MIIESGPRGLRKGKVMKLNNEEDKFFIIGQLKDEKSWIKRQFDTGRTYQLSHRKHNKALDPSTMSIDEIIDYANINYINDEKMINRENLIHDLIVFENYKDDLKYDIENNKKLFDFTGMTIGAYAGILSIFEYGRKNRMKIPNTGGTEGSPTLRDIIKVYMIALGSFLKRNITIILIILSIFLVIIMYKKISTGRKSKFNRLKTVNQVVRVLTNIKEQLS